MADGDHPKPPAAGAGGTSRARAPGKSGSFLRPVVKPTLRLNILAIFVALFAVTIGIIVWYSYRESSRAILDISGQVVGEVTQAAIERTTAYLRPLEIIAELTDNIGPVSDNGNVRTDRIAAFTREVVQAYPQLYSLYIGLEDGTLVQTVRIAKGSMFRDRQKGQLPTDVAFATRSLVAFDDGTARETWTYVDTEGRVLAQEWVTSKFDPRERTWYRGAKDVDDSYWTDLYIFGSLMRPGITASHPLRTPSGKFVGVVGADITMVALSEFLQKQKIGKTGVLFLFNGRDEVVAYPEPGKVVVGEGAKARTAKVRELGQPWLQAGYKQYLATGKPEFGYSHGGVDYLAIFTRFPKSFGKDWIFGAVVPVDDFVGPVKRTNRNTLIMSAVMLFFAIVAIWYVSHRISRPISALADETRRIQEFDLDHEIGVRSRIAEIQALTNSMQTMKTAIAAFASYVPKALVRTLIESGEGVQLGGEKRELTIFFSDILDFTAISEEMATDDLFPFISEYFSAVSGIILDHRGTIDKYIGDSIMAFWNAPVPDEKHTLHACEAVLQARDRVAEMNNAWEAAGKPALRTRFGLHFGEAIVGNIGSADRMNYTVLGDAVNLASRLEGVNTIYGTQILTSEDIYLRANRHYAFRPVDVVTVKGKRQATTIYELMGALDGGSSVAVTGEQKARCEAFEAAFTLFRSRQWPEAHAAFSSLADGDENDPLAAHYVERCQSLIDNPPVDWDGVTRLDSK